MGWAFSYGPRPRSRGDYPEPRGESIRCGRASRSRRVNPHLGVPAALAPQAGSAGRWVLDPGAASRRPPTPLGAARGLLEKLTRRRAGG